MTTTAAIEAVLRVGGMHLPALMGRLERRLTELATVDGRALAGPAGSTIAAGGKRLRPLLVYLAAGDAAGRETQLVRAATAVELIHSATLVHDDVVDRAELRRGRPSVVAASGRAVATATGDLLFARAFSELAANDRLDEIRVLSGASSALARGELMQRWDAFDATIPVERYLERCELKTARLFAAACELGALEGGGPLEVLGGFGRRIGLAFQLLDDILDVSGPPERTGKPRGTDLLDGTATLPLILAREDDPELSRLDLRALAGPQDAHAVCERIAATGALEEARGRALRIVAEAKADLPALPDGQRAALDLIADSVVDRYS